MELERIWVKRLFYLPAHFPSVAVVCPYKVGKTSLVQQIISSYARPAQASMLAIMPQILPGQ